MGFDHKAAGKTLTDLMAVIQPTWAILWAEQGVWRPEPPFWSLLFPTVAVVGSVDALAQTVDPAQIGQEIAQQVQGVRDLTISIQAFALAAQGDQHPALKAIRALAMAVQLPSQQDKFMDAGMGLAEVGAAQDLSAFLEADWESRASLDLRFHIVDDATERIGYIDFVVSPTGTLTP